MKRVAGSILVIGLLASGALGASGGTLKHARLTHCVAATHVQASIGLALFKGTCNGSKSNFKVQSHDITGRVGGLWVNFTRTGPSLVGKLGGRNSKLTFRGRTITGHYGPHRVKMTVRDRFTVAGRVGPMRVLCTVTPLLPLGERITCTGRRGGAGVLVPYLALLYAAP